MARPDPLPALTVLGLVGCALLATLHPTEAFDAERATDQAGRSVAVALEVVAVKPGDGWLRGTGVPTTDPEARPVEWLWFRPPDVGPLPGDRIEGRAKVERQGAGVMLVLDGAAGALVTPGPHAVAVRWADLVARPEQYAGRLLLLAGQVDGGLLVGPQGHTCPLAGDPPAAAHAAFTVRLVRSPDTVAWRCALGAPD